ncbi:NfeD family protein [Marinobacterium mangrovicola]|uniref:Membrane-bound serine protease (ClpP class) n=1 Tax=Marinobacterium mangrovicola TaxID=1476959 RepID=A0A4R1G946_9GAMM|nr:nodulation protein NfeD [Marinobacterium mangrovicola]TCK04168.1 membrane-bound serine protease (ClpP class) [Marinobacterium mangrovicola]
MNICWLRSVVLLAGLLLVVSWGAAESEAPQPPLKAAVWQLTLDGVVGPATADYLVRGLEDAAEEQAAAVLIRIDTPGGLDSSMRQMISAVLASPIPVICYVSPGGARAASAGTFLLYACHVAAMAPATNLGAATPVSIGTPMTPDNGGGQPGDGEGDTAKTQPGSAMERKVTNDAVAYIRGLAELRGRNADWAEKAVREGASLTASKALELGVIDLIAADRSELFEVITGRSVEINGRQVALDFSDSSIFVSDPDWRSEFLAVITNPNVAYMLMLIGLYGLIFEFTNPGFGLPGVLGAICLMVALYAFQVLPVSYAGLGLILLGLGLIAAEAMMPSFGVLGVGGLIAFVIGSIILMDTDIPAFQVALPVVAALAVTTGVLLFAVLGMALKAHHRPAVMGPAAMKEREAEIEQVYGDQVLARFEGELWEVRCAEPLKAGDRVRIHEIDGLTLVVDKQEA